MGNVVVQGGDKGRTTIQRVQKIGEGWKEARTEECTRARDSEPYENEDASGWVSQGQRMEKMLGSVEEEGGLMKKQRQRTLQLDAQTGFRGGITAWG